MCNCKNITFGSYGNQIQVKVPNNIELKYNNLDNNRRETVCIDECILDEIKNLWSKGIITTGCCCGHNLRDGYIGVQKEFIKEMKEMGYKVQFNPNNPNSEDSFYLLNKKI